MKRYQKAFYLLRQASSCVALNILFLSLVSRKSPLLRASPSRNQRRRMPPKSSATDKVPPPPPRRRKPLSEVLDDDDTGSQNPNRSPALSVPKPDSSSPQQNPLKKTVPPPPPSNRPVGGKVDTNPETAPSTSSPRVRSTDLQQTPLQAAARAGRELPNGLVNTPKTPTPRHPQPTHRTNLSEDGEDLPPEDVEVRGGEGGGASEAGEEEEDLPMDTWRTPCYDCRNYIRPMICEAWMCHPCNVALQLAAVQDNWNESEVNPVPCLGVIVFDVMACGLGSVLSSFFLRRQVKAKFDIGEELYAEIGIGCCCAPCSLAQTDRELRIRGQPPHTAWFEMPSLTKMASYRPPRGRTGKGPSSPPSSSAPRPASRR
jgi:Cys-rich protein (TIGR01571 family)